MKTRIYLLAFLFLFSCSPKEIEIEERSRFASEVQAELLAKDKEDLSLAP